MVENQTNRDVSAVWHPCTQMKDHEDLPPIAIRRGKGVWLEDNNGKRYLDAISSWWVNLFGHGNLRIGRAVRRQMDRIEHVMLAGFTHKPAIQLAERLVELSPPGLTRCFYSDNGSTAVEVALKMSYHYWLNRGRSEKRRFVCLANAYHGETLGALSVGQVPLYRKTYEPLLLEPLVAPSPDCYARKEGDTPEQHSRRMFSGMEALLERYKDEICAVIVEPLVQCAGYMRMYHPVYLSMLREACDRFQVHLIADEVAVGFGRTGTMFACEQAGISPDLLCLGKGLTGGFMTLAATLAGDEIYRAFYDDYTELNAFLHSHSYTGNPLACSAALASLDIFRQDSVLENNRHLAELMAEEAKDIEGHPNVADVRQCGMIMAIELARDGKTREPFPWQERHGRRIYRHALEHGVLLRPLGDVVYFMPPYVIKPAQVRQMMDAALEGIERAVAD